MNNYYLAFCKKVSQLGGQLNSGATNIEIEAVEQKLALKLPNVFKEYLRRFNGSDSVTDIGLWDFWPCQKITTYFFYTKEKYLEVLPTEGQKGLGVKSVDVSLFPAKNIVLFADAMIEIPIYGIYLEEGSFYDGYIFDVTTGFLCSRNFFEWISLFVDSSGECAL